MLVAPERVCDLGGRAFRWGYTGLRGSEPGELGRVFPHACSMRECANKRQRTGSSSSVTAPLMAVTSAWREGRDKLMDGGEDEVKGKQGEHELGKECGERGNRQGVSRERSNRSNREAGRRDRQSGEGAPADGG